MRPIFHLHKTNFQSRSFILSVQLKQTVHACSIYTKQQVCCSHQLRSSETAESFDCYFLQFSWKCARIFHFLFNFSVCPFRIFNSSLGSMPSQITFLNSSFQTVRSIFNFHDAPRAKFDSMCEGFISGSTDTLIQI